MGKKDGGQIEKWQLHHIEVPEEHLHLFTERFPQAIIPPILFTGAVVDDPTGRWVPGHHMRSTYIISLDRKTGIVETQNTIYKLDMKTENQDIFPDMGNKVLSVFY